MTFKIDNELKNLIPPLTIEEKKQLKENLLKEGIRDALVLGEYLDSDELITVLIDGHNRLEIANNNGLLYDTKTISFDNYESVKEWMILHQFGRRNLNNYQRSILALELEKVFQEKAKDNLILSGENFGKGSVISPNPIDKIDTRKQLSKVANVGEQTISRVKKIKEQATPELKEQLEKGVVSINQAYKEVKKVEKKEELNKKKELYNDRINSNSNSNFKVDIFNTKDTFRVIYADPPWSYNDKQNTHKLGGAQKHYQTMSIKEISNLPINKITEKDSILFLWVTSPLLDVSFDVIKAWGFKYKTSFVWDKIKHNMGHYNSVRHEFLLVATKGSCTPDNKKLYDSVQSIERNNNHSEKPIEFLDIIDNLYSYGNKLEMFSRKIKKNNWYGWGNEI